MTVWDLWGQSAEHAFDGIIGHFRHIMKMQMNTGCFEAYEAKYKPIDQRRLFLVLSCTDLQGFWFSVYMALEFWKMALNSN